MQDWRLAEGRMECFVSGGDRNVYWLTHEISDASGAFTMSVRLGRMTGEELGEGYVGFRTGIRGHFHDWRDNAVYGEGVNAGVTTDGRLFLGTASPSAPKIAGKLEDVQLTLRATPRQGKYDLVLEAVDAGTRQTTVLKKEAVPNEWLAGGVALVCSAGEIPRTPAPLHPIDPDGIEHPGTARRGNVHFWFRNWTLTGSKVAVHDGRSFGPIYFAQHTLSRGVLKITAQIAPLDTTRAQVFLDVRKHGKWSALAESSIDPLARTASFRVAHWDDTQNVPYRVRCIWKDGNAAREDHFVGTIRRDPKDKPEVLLAVFTCHNDLGFPQQDIVKNLQHFKPDLLVFTGDQIYERVGGYGNQRAPLEAATLDYLRKWVLFGWAFCEVLRDIPAITIPDDHDVYHGNVWGAGGRKAEAPDVYPSNPGNSIVPSDRIMAAQDAGGYTMPAGWVNMIQRTQTSHLPDPFDPTPVLQNIEVYYTDLLYGGISIAILEDRKWKSSPRAAIPWADIRNGWAKNPDYHAPRDGDVKGAELLGARQIQFLNQWAANWDGAWIKAVVSQTLFANLATLPPPANTDDPTPDLPVLPLDGYAEGEIKVADHDSNGWPQTPRNQALRAFRRGVAVHLGGDQHLGSTVQYGIDDWNDGPYALCVPPIANVWPRRWYPREKGKRHQPGSPRNTGEYLDGFGNKMTVHLVANPALYPAEPVELHKRVPGYGLARFDRKSRTIELSNWPRFVEAWQPGAKPYTGWPLTIHQLDNGLNAAKFMLPAVSVEQAEPVFQVVHEESGEILYTLRCASNTFQPPVFREGVYSVRLLGDGGKLLREWLGQTAQSRPSHANIGS
jgi:hypothetical protein